MTYQKLMEQLVAEGLVEIPQEPTAQEILEDLN